MAFYDGLLFNGTDLNAIEGVEIDRVGLDSPPDVVLMAGKLSRSDGLKVYRKEYGGRKIPVEGRIMSSSREGYLNIRNQLLKVLNPKEKTLRVIIGNTPLEFTATVESTIFSDTGGGYGRIVINFLLADPFGYDRDARTIINGTLVTTASSTVSLLETIGGSYAAPATFTATVAAITGGTGKYMDLANELGENIRVTRTWVLNDVLVVNMKDKTARVNGALVDYTGTFWSLSPDNTSITYSDNFTTRSVGLVATYKRRYL